MIAKVLVTSETIIRRYSAMRHDVTTMKNGLTRMEQELKNVSRLQTIQTTAARFAINARSISSIEEALPFMSDDDVRDVLGNNTMRDELLLSWLHVATTWRKKGLESKLVSMTFTLAYRAKRNLYRNTSGE